MKSMTQPIPLAGITPESRGTLIKTGALSVFRLLRSAAAQARTLPGLAERVAHDIREAWEESASPKR